MRLRVEHRSSYRFDQAVRGLVQSLRLNPSDCANQRVLDWSVDVEGGTLGAGFRDGAGDWVQTLTTQDPIETVTLSAIGTVETDDLSGVLKGLRETVHPAVYLRRSRATASNQAIKDLANEAVAGAGSALDKAHALSHAVAERIVYTQGETDAMTSAAEALERGVGVCQDHAHVMIAASTSVGVPARYVTGYLYSEAGAAMAQASHAWAELHVPDLGWVGFDAANSCCPDHRYVRLGSGFDAIDAAPIRGLTMATVEEHLDVDVNVGQVQQ